MEFTAQEKFYLEHEKQILEWGRLKGEVPGLISRFIEELKVGLQHRVSECAGPAEVWVKESGKFPQLFLSSPAWRRPCEGGLPTCDKTLDGPGGCTAHGGDLFPLCSIGTEWDMAKPIHSKGWAYLGIWVNGGRFPAAGQMLSAAIRTRLEESEKDEKMDISSSSSHWPISKWEAPRVPFWENPEAYAAQVIDSTVGLWDRVWADVDDAVNSLEGDLLKG